MNILNTQQVLEILNVRPEAEFSLQPVRVEFQGGGGHGIAGYHIFEGHLPKMIHTTGDAIWTYVPHPGPSDAR